MDEQLDDLALDKQATEWRIRRPPLYILVNQTRTWTTRPSTDRQRNYNEDTAPVQTCKKQQLDDPALCRQATELIIRRPRPYKLVKIHNWTTRPSAGTGIEHQKTALVQTDKNEHLDDPARDRHAANWVTKLAIGRPGPLPTCNGTNYQKTAVYKLVKKKKEDNLGEPAQYR